MNNNKICTTNISARHRSSKEAAKDHIGEQRGNETVVHLQYQLNRRIVSSAQRFTPFILNLVISTGNAPEHLNQSD